LILNKIDVEGAEKLRDDTVQKVKCMRGNLLIFVDAVKLVHVFFLQDAWINVKAMSV